MNPSEPRTGDHGVRSSGSPSDDHFLKEVSEEVLVQGLGMSYGEFTALRDASFSFRRGTITALVGPNGAGKSTLMKVLGGVLPFHTGSISLFGSAYAPASRKLALSLGVAAIYQELSLIDDWMVWEHFPASGPSIWLQREQQSATAKRSLADVGANMDVALHVRDLTAPQRQSVEIAKALACNARVLLVDEPTAGLDADARDRVFDALKSAANSGCAVLVVSHDLRTVLKRSDSVVLLRDGQVIFQRPAAEVRISDVGGTEHSESRAERISRSHGPVLRIWDENSSEDSPLMEVEPGSIYGIAAHALSNGSDLLRSALGMSRSFDIQVEFRGERCAANPYSGYRRGIIYVSRERSSEWLFPEHSIARNLNAASFARLSRSSFVVPARELQNAEQFRNSLGLVARSLNRPVVELSGGNQQKVVVGRALSANPAILLLDEPFSGIDKTTRLRVNVLLRDFVKDGGIVILFSRELDELIASSDVIAVFKRDVTLPEYFPSTELTLDQLQSRVIS